MKQNSFYVSAAVAGVLAAGFLLAGCGAGASSAASSPPAASSSPTASAAPQLDTAGQSGLLTAEQAKARMDSGDEIIVLDVRTAEEYAEAHIPGAVLLPNEEIGDTPPAQLPDKGTEILIYCRSGNRSAQAAKKLAALGYTNVFDFGGIKDWPYETESGGTQK